MNDFDDMTFKDVRAHTGMGWRIALSILSGTVLLAFLVIWLFFYAGDYNIWENLGVLLMSLVMVAVFNGLVWVPFGLQFGAASEIKTWRSVASAAIGIACVGFLLLWLFFYAGEFNVYQNIAVIIVVMIVGGGLNAVAWVRH